jgi:hypothetical protein
LLAAMQSIASQTLRQSSSCKAGRLVAECLDMLVPEIRSGVTTEHIDRLVFEFAMDYGAMPGTLIPGWGLTGGLPQPRTLSLSMTCAIAGNVCARGWREMAGLRIQHLEPDQMEGRVTLFGTLVVRALMDRVPVGSHPRWTQIESDGFVVWVAPLKVLPAPACVYR